MEKGEIKLKSFIDLDHTFSSGQIFRWRKLGDYWVGVCYSSLLALKKVGDRIVYKIEGNLKTETLYEFLGLNQDYEVIIEKICKNRLIKEICEKYYGLRIFHQSKRECLISYICAIYNNIERTNKILEALSKLSKRKLRIGNITYYDYPTLEEIQKIGEEKLRELGLGFRASFLANLNISDSWLDELNELGTEDLENQLMKIKGVGIKTASCISLYGYLRFESFPIDTWIYKFITNFFKDDLEKLLGSISINDIKKNFKIVKNFYNKLFDNYAGYAQIFFYKYARDHLRKSL